jgi:hypothetical protein
LQNGTASPRKPESRTLDANLERRAFDHETTIDFASVGHSLGISLEVLLGRIVIATRERERAT